MPSGEGRFSRWSRLKQAGGADAREERQAEQEATQVATETARRPQPAQVNLPGGTLRRHVVPAMPPLAAALEEGDDAMTRGIGHELLSETATTPETSAQDSDKDLFVDIEERELTAEEQAAVDALPPIETLKEESDFTPYLQVGIPDFIKRKALRMLWRSNPFFGFRDGMNDYDHDYNIIHKTIDALVGNYKVGRGHLSEQELQEMMPEQAKRAFDVEDEEADPAAEDPDLADAAPAPESAPALNSEADAGSREAPLEPAPGGPEPNPSPPAGDDKDRSVS